MRILTDRLSHMWADSGRRNRTLGRILIVVWAMHFGISYTTTFYKGVGLSYTQIFGILAVMAVFTGVSEIAFGLTADGRGNKRMLLAGLGFQVFSSWSISQARTFGEMAGATILTSMSWSMTSGTVNSIVKASSSAAETKRYNLTSPRFSGAGAIAGVIIGAGLHEQFGLTMVFQAQPIAFLIGLTASIFLIDQRSVRQVPDEGALKSVLRTLFADRPDIRWRMLLAATISTGSLAMLWLIQPDMKDAGFNDNLFAWLYLIRAVTGTVLSLCITRLYNWLGDMRTQLLLIVVIGGSSVFAGLPNDALSSAGSVLLLLATAMEFTLVQALMTNAINDAVPEHQTTTAQSTYSSLKALFGIAIIPIGPLQNSVPTDITLMVIGLVVLGFGTLCYIQQKRADGAREPMSTVR